MVWIAFWDRLECDARVHLCSRPMHNLTRRVLGRHEIIIVDRFLCALVGSIKAKDSAGIVTDNDGMENVLGHKKVITFYHVWGE